MKKKIKKYWPFLIACAVALAVCFWGGARAAETEEVNVYYKAVTPEGEAAETAQVKVEEVKTVIVRETYTVAEIDYYIEVYQGRVQEYQKAVDNLKAMRVKIEAEAKKVKLKVAGEDL